MLAVVAALWSHDSFEEEFREAMGASQTPDAALEWVADHSRHASDVLQAYRGMRDGEATDYKTSWGLWASGDLLRLPGGEIPQDELARWLTGRWSLLADLGRAIEALEASAALLRLAERSLREVAAMAAGLEDGAERWQLLAKFIADGGRPGTPLHARLDALGRDVLAAPAEQAGGLLESGLRDALRDDVAARRRLEATAPSLPPDGVGTTRPAALARPRLPSRPTSGKAKAAATAGPEPPAAGDAADPPPTRYLGARDIMRAIGVSRSWAYEHLHRAAGGGPRTGTLARVRATDWQLYVTRLLSHNEETRACTDTSDSEAKSTTPPSSSTPSPRSARPAARTKRQLGPFLPAGSVKPRIPITRPRKRRSTTP